MLRATPLMTRSLTGIAVAAGIAIAASGVRADDTGFAYAHDLRKEHGKLCMTGHWHSGSGTGSSKAAAKRAAMRSWIDFTNFEYGSVWARYGRAASKSVRYAKESSGWSATVEGRPCRL